MVDDYEPFRRFVVSALQQESEFQIVVEISDGAQAVLEAAELQPDLIVLDIGLPNLSGIQVATRIRSRSPLAKILFVSQETSTEIVQAAFGTGAQGYVVKMDAARELMTAVNAVLEGGTYVSTRLRKHDFGQSLAPGAMSHDELLASAAPKSPHNIGRNGRHEVLFYSGEWLLLDHLTKFIIDALKGGNAVIVMATEQHRVRLVPRLQAYGLDFDAAIGQGRYIVLDSADMLSTFMVNGMPDPLRFMEGFSSLIQRASKAMEKAHSRIAVFGDCVRILLERGEDEAAIQMEKLGNQLAILYNVDILCAYSINGLAGALESQMLQRICAEHSAIHSC